MVNAAFTVEDGIARIELQRPEALNAMEMPTKREIIERVRAYRDDDSVRVVVFQSEGDSFCAGGDLKEVEEHDFALEPFTDSWEELFEAMMNLGKPTVARIDGYTLGGGFDLMLHTDIPIAAADAKLGQPEVGLGIVNHFSPPMLQASVGLTKTLDLMMTGDLISGEEAERMGLVARSVPREELDEEVNGAVESLAEKSPRVLRKLKDGIYATAEMSPRASRSYLETIALDAARTDPDYREGVEAQLEDRDPDWE
jgi:enoyl-CoA hydratase/carnithine racemase